MRALILAVVAAMMLSGGRPARAEVCRYAGTTDPYGKVSVAADVSARDGTTRVDVAATFDTTTWFWFHVHYLVDEVSLWRAGELETVGVNTRYLIGGHVVRQTWDVFRRDRDAMQGYRVQGKTLAEFRRRHPKFVKYWDPSTFDRPWLDDFPAAAPERRADLDLRGVPASARLMSPLALAFYWIRWLPPGGQDEAVFLPGFKADKLVDVPIMEAARGTVTLWRAPLRYPAFSKKPPSTAEIWMSPDRHLLQLALDVHEPRGSGRGVLRQTGCEGPPVVPTGVAR